MVKRLQREGREDGDGSSVTGNCDGEGSLHEEMLIKIT